MKPSVVMAIGAGLALAAAGAASAQLSPKAAIDARSHGYHATGAAFKTIRDQLRSQTPSISMVQLAAQRLQQTGHDQYGWFPAGSGPGPGVKTQAKPEIWTDPSGFHDAQARFQKEADLMVQAVGTGDQAGIQAQAKAVGDACGACHQKYRQKD